jgi:hypothetical protein
VAETETPQPMDVAGEPLLYDEFRPNVHPVVYRFQILQQVGVIVEILIVLRLLGIM